MAIRISLAVITVLGITACGSKWTPPDEPSPIPSYFPIDAPESEVWNAAVDFLVDTGTEWEFISDELRLAKLQVILVRGTVKDNMWVYNPKSSRWAHCGAVDGEPVAGYGDLWGSIAIRVRYDDDGTGLLKVVMLDVWQERKPLEPDICVSTGEFEKSVVEAIQQKVVPTLDQRRSFPR